MAQLTGLRQLIVSSTSEVSAVGLRWLAALQQLTSLGLGRFLFARHANVLNTLAHHLMKDKLPYCPYAMINKVCWCCACSSNGVCCVWCSGAGWGGGG